MTWFLLFLSGALLCNAIPHLVSGLRGDPFPTPFAKPPGKGNSPPLVNFLWGFANLVLGLTALLNCGPAPMVPGLAVMAAGALAIGVFASIHFGKVRSG
jgi:hypothetical protein